jgi:DNA-binding LacI/PurR family transcriptional regulator
VATEHLLQLGAKRIAFFSFPRGPGTIEERIAGYREALFMHGVTVDPDLVRRLSSDDDTMIRRTIDSVKPEAVVCANDRTAARLMQVLLSMGMRIPDDVRIVGIDDVAYASLFPVPLTTLHQPCREIGMAAMNAIIERVARPEMPAREVFLECPLVVRDSCGAKRGG